MRGSIKWQVIQLVRIIFQEGLSKKERSNKESYYFQMVTQDTTMETYKLIWIEFGNFAKTHYKIKDIEDLDNTHIEQYLLYKISNTCAQQTLEKLSSALGKLEIALQKFTYLSGKNRQYNFNNRVKILNYARDFKLVYDGYHSRVYANPNMIINRLENTNHQLCARMQLEGGARIGGLEYLKKEVKVSYSKLEANRLIDSVNIDRVASKYAYLQTLQGICFDPILEKNGVKKEIGKILTVEKGGRPGLIYLTTQTYKELELFFKENSVFIVNRFGYMKKIEDACCALGYEGHGSHGFRWTHVQNRQEELLLCGFSEQEALLLNSIEHKHWRSEITSHYLG